MSKNNHGKRMVPEYLIAKLETLEPGSDYTAGAGISIEDGVLSVDYGTGLTVSDGTLVVDTSVIASKSDIVTSYNDLTDKPDLSIYAQSANLATVATTGDYDDLIDKPTIPTSATSTSTVTPSTIQLTFTYSDNTTETITVMTGASVTTTTTLS